MSIEDSKQIHQVELKNDTSNILYYKIHVKELLAVLFTGNSQCKVWEKRKNLYSLKIIHNYSKIFMTFGEYRRIVLEKPKTHLLTFYILQQEGLIQFYKLPILSK